MVTSRVDSNILGSLRSSAGPSIPHRLEEHHPTVLLFVLLIPSPEVEMYGLRTRTRCRVLQGYATMAQHRPLAWDLPPRSIFGALRLVPRRTPPRAERPWRVIVMGVNEQ